MHFSTVPCKIPDELYHFFTFTQQFKIQKQRVQYATYNRLGVCIKV